MPRRKPRSLRQDEVDLWAKAVEKAVPLHPNRPLIPEEKSLTQKKTHKSAPESPRRLTPRFQLGEASKPKIPSHDLAPSISEHVARQPVAMDRKRFTKLKKGRLSPEARIDLHGMTLDQAHPALTRFILGAVADGRRLVLVITGKGKTKPDHGPIPERHGALRHNVPHWLHSAPLKTHILQITEAHVKHGGQGAYYVYLRRPKA